jgi:hypothetical protein
MLSIDLEKRGPRRWDKTQTPSCGKSQARMKLCRQAGCSKWRIAECIALKQRVSRSGKKSGIGSSTSNPHHKTDHKALHKDFNL